MIKKYILFIVVTIVIFSLKPLYAAPSWGTHMPEDKKWIWGLEGNFLRDRNLDNDQGGTDGNRYFLTGSYGIFSWASFDGKIGAGDVDWHRTRGNSNLNYDTNFAGAYGFRIKGYDLEQYGIKSVIGFQHISVHPEAKNQDNIKHEAIIDEWQGSAVISKDMGKIVPYLGVRYGTLDYIKWENEHDRKRIKSERNYGFIIGLDYHLDNRTKINIEGIFIDSEEFAIGLSREF